MYEVNGELVVYHLLHYLPELRRGLLYQGIDLLDVLNNLSKHLSWTETLFDKLLCIRLGLFEKIYLRVQNSSYPLYLDCALIQEKQFLGMPYPVSERYPYITHKQFTQAGVFKRFGKIRLHEVPVVPFEFQQVYPIREKTHPGILIN